MNQRVQKLLVIDDDTDVLHSVQLFLRQYFTEIETVQDPSTINQVISQRSYDLVLLDMNFRRGEHNGREGLYWLEHLRAINPDLPVIMITAYGDVELAVEAMRRGAASFVLKPWKNQQLLDAVRSVTSRGQKTKSPTAVASVDESETMIGESPAMLAIRNMVDKVANTEANVLILGESGTGKEQVAKAIHRQSHRRSKPLVHVDLGAVAPSLLESELFGHVKGAFTDAHTDRMGKFEQADGGTLFLDEMGNLPLSSQAKLLAVLQRRTVRRVGGNEEVPLNIRLLCATHQPLYERVQEGVFREDLLYRINTVEILVPPLRERTGDLMKLLDHFLLRYAQQYHKDTPSLTARAVQKLSQYAWPGNVRELQHAAERAVILSETSTLDAEAFSLREAGRVDCPTVAEAATLEENERNFIQRTLQQHQGNITQTAKALGITRTALYRRLGKYGL